MSNRIPALFLGLALLASCPPESLAAETLPSARDVVVRGAKDLPAALRLAARSAWAPSTRPRPVLVVADVTPYLARSEEALVDAFARLGRDAENAAGWRIARLGGKPGPLEKNAAGLARYLPAVLVEEEPIRNTYVALRKTIAALPGRDAVVVLLADWHFEDDHGLERLVSFLRNRGHSLSVVGSEAAFGRGWNDGFFAGPKGMRDPKAGGSYDPHIGRDPFGSREAERPWHGGDTAYPHFPMHYRGISWSMEFSANDSYAVEVEDVTAAGEPDDEAVWEDLRERLAAANDEPTTFAGNHPIPSGWGPYGFTRLAAATGGRYVTWSWNPAGRPHVHYDYARLEHFPPDLRPRDAIKSDVRRRPLARALMNAWLLMSSRRTAVAAITAPLEKDLSTPARMVESRFTGCLCSDWMDAPVLARYLRTLKRTTNALDAAIDGLDVALAASPDGEDDVDRRYRADADLARHILLVARFSLGEAHGAARLAPKDAWDTPDRYPLVFETAYLVRGSDPEHVKPRTEHVFDHGLAARVVADRKRMLERYADTPWSAVVARNVVNTYRLGWGRRVPATGDGKGARNPAESEGDDGPTTPPDAPPAGSSSGGGPATGK